MRNNSFTVLYSKFAFKNRKTGELPLSGSITGVSTIQPRSKRARFMTMRARLLGLRVRKPLPRPL